MPEAKIYLGDVRKRLSEIPDGSVRTCITSPPYFALRDYGTATWEGGDPNCEHTISATDADRKAVFAERVTRGDRTSCLQCGAKRIDAQIGLEQTPDEYVSNLVIVFREIYRVLSDDGTLWLNLGDSYAGGGGGNYNKTGVSQAGGQHVTNVRNRPEWLENAGVKQKDLLGIPWMVAFALRADGWYLRSEIIWHKPNPMPESVRDRPTKSHEQLFLLSKSPKYYYDLEAVKEPVASGTEARYSYGFGSAVKKQELVKTGKWHTGKDGRDNLSGDMKFASTRNKRSVWTINTKPFKGAHFAVMPEALVEPCLLAGSSEKGKCSACGKPWVRVVESKRIRRNELDPSDPRYRPNTYEGAYEGINGKGDAGYNSTTTLGWEASCECDAEIVPDVVLDPFTGSGTVAVVALRNGRNFVGTELNPEYGQIAYGRITGENPMFNQVEVIE